MKPQLKAINVVCQMFEIVWNVEKSVWGNLMAYTYQRDRLTPGHQPELPVSAPTRGQKMQQSEQKAHQLHGTRASPLEP